MATDRFEIIVSSRGTKTVSRDIRNIGRSASATRKTLALLRSALVVFASIRVFTGLLTGLANFSQSMSTVRAVTQATGAQFEGLRDKAKELGATTRFTATQAAEGMVALGRAGFKTNEILATIKPTLTLAQAGALDLGRAADISSNVLRSFGLAANESQRVVDVLAFTANNANTTVTELGDAMKFVSPVASAFGVSLEETSAALAQLSQLGLKGSIGGTGLKRLIGELESPGTKFRKVLAEIHLEAEKIRPSSVGLADSLQALKDAGLGSGIALELFGQRAGPVFIALQKAIPELKAFTENLKNSGGAAQKAADIMDDNLNGALLRVKSALEANLLSFGELGAESSATQFFNNLAKILRVTAANMDDVVASATVLLGVLAANRLGATVVSLASAFVRLGASLKTLTFSTLLSGIPLAIGLFGGLVAAMVAFRDEIVVSQERSIVFADVLSSFSTILGNEVLNAVNTLGGSFGDLGEIFDAFVTRLGQGMTRILASVVGGVDAIKAAWQNFPSFLLGIAKQAANLAIREIQRFVNETLSLLEALLNRVAGINVSLGRIDLSSFELNLTKDQRQAGENVAKAFASGYNRVIKGALEAGASRKLNEQAEEALAGYKAAERAAAAAQTLGKKEATKTGPTVPEILGGGGGSSGGGGDIRSSLESLIGSANPAIAVMNKLKDATKTLNEARAAGINIAQEYGITEADVLRRVEREALGFGNALEDAAGQQKLLDSALQRGVITLDEYKNKINEVRLQALEGETGLGAGIERTFLKLNQSVNDVASQAEDVLTNAFRGIEDAMVEFVKTGKLSFDDLIDSILSDLTRLATRAVLGNLAGAFGLGGGMNNGGLLGGLFGGSGSSSIFGGLFGGGSGGGLLSGLGSLLGFAEGGSFTVGPGTSLARIPGIDNRLVAIRARDNERVHVTKPGQDFTNQAPTIVMNINTPDANSFRKSQGQIMSDAFRAGSRAAKRNG